MSDAAGCCCVCGESALGKKLPLLVLPCHAEHTLCGECCEGIVAALDTTLTPPKCPSCRAEQPAISLRAKLNTFSAPFLLPDAECLRILDDARRATESYTFVHGVCSLETGAVGFGHEWESSVPAAARLHIGVELHFSHDADDYDEPAGVGALVAVYPDRGGFRKVRRVPAEYDASNAAAGSGRTTVGGARGTPMQLCIVVSRAAVIAREVVQRGLCVMCAKSRYSMHLGIKMPGHDVCAECYTADYVFAALQKDVRRAD